MQEGRRKVEATGSTRYPKPWWNKIGWDRTFKHLDGFRHSVLAKKPFLAQFNDSDTQIHTIQNYITEVYPVLIH